MKLLILGGTAEARALAKAVAATSVDAILSLAGRVERPIPQPIACRSGGFGGVSGLARWIEAHGITHMVDATHPFAAQISANAVAAATQSGCAFLAIERPPWSAQPGDRWQTVAHIDAAVAAIAGPTRSVFLAIGRQNLAPFAVHRQHRYLLRLVDPPSAPLSFERAEIVIDRGPFSKAGDRELFEAHGIDMVVCKNSGGVPARAKIEVARERELPVVMIQRPAIPKRPMVEDVEAALRWLGLGHDQASVAKRGV